MTQIGLRDRKKVRTRRVIEDVALRLFAEQGFDATTIDQIVSEAEVSPRTFFRYFATKEDVVLADYSEQLDDILEDLSSRPFQETPWESMRAVFRTMASDPGRRSKMLPRAQMMANAPSVFARSLQLQAGWEIQLATALRARSGDKTDEISPALMAAAALGIMRAAIRRWSEQANDIDLPEFVDECFDRLNKGFGS
ncbi:MAG: TetR family transcriptional regulator [Microthrixaceae bacterium]